MRTCKPTRRTSLVPRGLLKPVTDSIEQLAFARAVKEATYYLEEIDPGFVSAEFRNFLSDALSRRLQYTPDGWLTFDGKKLAHIKDTQP